MAEINFEEDSRELEVPTAEGMGKLAELANRQIILEDELKQAQEEVERIAQDLDRVSKVEIPDLFLEMNIKEFKLIDGTKVTVSQFYSASIKEELRERAFRWLRQCGFGDIIKHEIATNFKMGEDEMAKQLCAYLLQHKFSFNDREQVHPQTLKKFVKEQIEADETGSFPRELFSVYEGKLTKIERRKNGKGR